MPTFKISTIVTILTCVSRYLLAVDVKCLQPFCKCDNRDGVCSGKSLTYIPPFPQFITRVTIRNISLDQITKNGFSNLTINVMKKISLSKNGLQYIHKEAFVKASYLGSLEISNEPHINITSLKHAFESLQSDRLVSLSLIFNNWLYIPSDFFSSFQNPKFSSVKLNNNNLQYIDLRIFQYFKRIRYLDLSNNMIKGLTLGYLPSLSRLYLSNNSLSYIPSFCQMNNSSFFPRLQRLNLNINYIYEITKHSFDCLPKMESLYLDNSNVKVLKDNVFSVLPLLKQLSLKKSAVNLRRIENFAFNSSSLEKLSLAESKFRFDRLRNWYNPELIFSSCRNLRDLDLTNNYLPNDQTTLQKLFQPLEKLQKLTLKSAGLLEFPKNVFYRMPSLKQLNLQSNYINQWSDIRQCFGNISSLRYLILSNNFITVINETSFSKNILSSLEKLDLSNNPFACTCDQNWFLDWIERTDIKMVAYPRYYVCRQPTHMHGVLLDEYKPTDEICNPWNHLYTLAIALPLVLIFVAVLAFLGFKCQTNIKNYIYLLRVLSVKIRDGDSFVDTVNCDYHAFVVYCDADRLWVHGELLRRIETEMNMKLCIHHRDFRVGETITGNIDNFLNKSWKILVIMSNNFAKSEWCQWEVDVVQERRRKIGENAVIPIMYQNIDSKHMTSQIRMLINSTPYISYQSGVGEKLFWKTLFESLKRPLGHPPISII